MNRLVHLRRFLFGSTDYRAIAVGMGAIDPRRIVLIHHGPPRPATTLESQPA